MTQLSECGQLLHRYDYDRFLTGLFAPSEKREGLFAVYAFNLEIARTREAVSEPMLGRIRLQWWRETIDEIFSGKVRRHEVVEPLARAVSECSLPRGILDGLIDAREADLSDEAPKDLPELLTYAGATGGDLLSLAGHALGVSDDKTVSALRSTGTAYALVGTIRAVPFHARAKRQMLPADLVAAAGLRSSDYLEIRPVAEIVPVVQRIVEEARRLLDAARLSRSMVDRRALPALAHARLTDLYLADIERGGFQPMTPGRPISNLRKQLSLYWTLRRRRF